VNKLVKFLLYAAVIVLCYMVVNWVYKSNSTNGSNGLLGSTSETAINWFSLNEYLLSVTSDFEIKMQASITNTGINLIVESDKAGDLLVFGAVENTDKVIPLCSNDEFIDAKHKSSINCEHDEFANAKGNKMVFVFVTESALDEQAIRRFVQLRSKLMPGQTFKGLDMSGTNATTGQAANQTENTAVNDPAQEQSETTEDVGGLGLAYKLIKA
jgi:hypothetical protein